MIKSLSSLLDQKDKKVLFAGIGNVLRSDDGAGVYICNGIIPGRNIDTLIVEVSIENYIKKINDLNPDILILVDCVNFSKEPGYTDLLSVKEVADFTTNTHNISLKRVAEFFRMEVMVLGIQPASISFGENLSNAVKDSADNLINSINKIIYRDFAGGLIVLLLNGEIAKWLNCSIVLLLYCSIAKLLNC